jgi:hypothetical protein
MNYHFQLLRTTRQNALSLMSGLTNAQLNTIPEKCSNNILWNVGHMIAVQQLLVYRLSYLEVHTSEAFIEQFKKGSQPKQYSNAEIEEVKSLAISTVDLLEEDYKNGIFKQFKTYTTGYNATLSNVEEAIMFNNIHEGLHFGYAMALRKLV